jgi:hypothetical protein
MNNLNEQLFQEINDEIAANLSGGAAILYKNGEPDPRYGGRSLVFYEGTASLGDYWDFENETSAIVITGNEKWNFYAKDNYNDYLATLGPGEYDSAELKDKGIPNNSLSSLRISPNSPS